MTARRHLQARGARHVAHLSATDTTRQTTPPRRAPVLALAGALLGVGLGALTLPAPLLAATVQEDDERRTYAIPGGRLGDVLARFAATAGVPLSFDPQLLAGRGSDGLQGSYTIKEGFDRLLAGSGYVLRDMGAAGYSLQALPAPAGQLEAPHLLAPVTVTATLYGSRETTALNNSSASVGIVKAEDIALGQITTVQDSFRRLANVMDAAFLNSGFVIRGMSTEGFVPSGAPMGSVYVDGVLQTRYSARFGARNLWDAEQVEVYRGPQSTLSGRAATAGAVYIKTKDPTFKREAELSGTGGNHDLWGTAFMLNTPLSEGQLALRISGSVERVKTPVSYPTYRQYANYDRFKTEISNNLRAKLLLLPASAPSTRAVLSYAYSDDRPNERLVGEGADFGFGDERGDWYAFPTYAEFRQTTVHNLGLELTHDFNDSLRLTSQTGNHLGKTRRRSVDAGTAGLVDGLSGEVEDRLLTQELRLNYEGERWSWVAGVFGSYQDYDSTFGAALVPHLQLAESFRRRTTNLAAFGEATYEFLPTWRATLGGRLDYLRERTAQRNAETYPYGGVPFTYENSADFDEYNFVPKVGLSKSITPDHTVGATYTQGFRTGGFYVNYNTGQAQYYDPETAQNYELYYKGSYLDGRLSLNANLFLTRYKDQQIEIRPDPADQSYRETANAASSRTWGLEIEPTYQANERLSLFASLGYLNTRFQRFNHASYGDLSGRAFPEAPEWSVGLGGRYQWPGGFYLGADAKYTSGYEGRFGIPPQDTIGSRVIVNAQLGYRQDRWQVSVFARNLFDKRYVTFIDREAQPAYAQLGAERSVGVNLKLRF